VNVQVIADAAGRLIWVSPALPGSTHDLSAARTHDVIDALTSNNVMTFADKGYQGTRGSGRTPFNRHRHRHRPRLSRRQKAVNLAHAKIRARGERAIATLKTCKILTKLRCCPRRTTAILQAILVLHRVDTYRYAGCKALSVAKVTGVRTATSAWNRVWSILFDRRGCNGLLAVYAYRPSGWGDIAAPHHTAPRRNSRSINVLFI